MEKTKPQISSSQLFVLLMLARIMYTMLYQTTGFTSGTPMMWGQLISTGIEAVLSIPLLIFLSKGEPLAESISQKPSVQTFIYVGFAVYFTVLFSMMLAAFSRFMHSEFSVIGTPVVVVILLALASAYCANLGLEGLARSAVIVFFGVIVLIASMALLSEGEINMLYLQSMAEGDTKTMLGYIIEDIGSSWWLPMAASLAGSVKKNAWKAGVGYLIGKFIFVEGLIFLVTVILWRFINVPGYPILALGAYAKTDFIQRFDSVNMFVWTLNCVVVGGSFIYNAGRIGKNGNKLLIWLCAAASAALACVQFYKLVPLYEKQIVTFRICGSLILGVLLPIAALIAMKRRRKCV